MTPRQIKAARNWLGLSQAEMSDAAGVSISTIKKLEAGDLSVHHAFKVLVEHELLSRRGIYMHGDADKVLKLAP